MLTEVKITLEEKTKKKYKKEIKMLHKAFVETKVNSFFQVDMKLSKEVEKEFENHFSSNHYSEDSGAYFEGWPVMTLLKHSMEIGFRLGRNPKLFNKNRVKLIKIMNQWEKLKFKPLKEHRDFDLFFIDRFVWKDKRIAYYVDLLGNHHNFNPKIFTPEIIKNNLNKWESRFNRIHVSI
jgi:hypothetical protein